MAAGVRVLLTAARLRLRVGSLRTIAASTRQLEYAATLGCFGQNRPFFLTERHYESAFDDVRACRHGKGVRSSGVRSLASRYFNGGSTWLATWPCQCEEALKSHVFWRVDGRALDAALLHRRKLRDPLFRALLHARSMRSVLAVSDTTENRAIVLLVLR